MPVVVDASVWIDYFAGRFTPQTGWLDNALGKEPLAVADLSLGEVLRGFVDEGPRGLSANLRRSRTLDAVGQ